LPHSQSTPRFTGLPITATTSLERADDSLDLADDGAELEQLLRVLPIDADHPADFGHFNGDINGSDGSKSMSTLSVSHQRNKKESTEIVQNIQQQ
jgi:hypothetical protein